MTIGTMGANKVLFTIFFSIDLLFLRLFINTLGWSGETWHTLAAYSELGIAILSFYASAANVLNNHYGITVLPVGAAFSPWARAAQAVKGSIAA